MILIEECFNQIFELGSQRNFSRRGASYTVKDEGAVSLSEGKPSKKGVVGHSAHEVYMSYTDVFCYASLLESPCKMLICLQKQVWVQKSSSGS